jgi:hypothetical protein
MTLFVRKALAGRKRLGGVVQQLHKLWSCEAAITTLMYFFDYFHTMIS